ncbi:unnamed protein product [Cyprideis torosa]|uniref:Uncharacterized protein n=1 Tax=Cyprideis torosa TaxID=163714 RepID=A0A7R8WAZ8_9CRUS|nr:unnamed protein product [Cyprideis torosa]CAG0891579.1 unnamed protein product [Cyprideis torosa]
MSLLIGAHMGIPGYGREGKESVGEQDLRRYANFGDKSVELICESSGYPEVHPEAHKLLAEDLSFRLRDLTHTCSQFLRHGKRRKLTPRDVDLALRAKKFDRLLGYSSKEPTHFQYVRDAEVFIANDREVEVGDLALDNLPFYHHGRSYVTMRTIHHSWRTDPYANGLSPNELICYKRIARATVEGGAEFPILARFARNTRVFQSNLIISSILTLVQRLVVDLCHDGYVLGRVLCLLDSFVSNKTTELLVNYYELLSGTAKCVRVAREDTASRIITTISESLEHSTLYGAFAGAIALRLPMDATLVVVQQATPIDGSFWDWQHMNFKLLCWIAMAYRFSFKHAVAELNSPLPSMKCPHVLALHAMRSVFEWQIEPMLCQLPYSPYLNPILEEQILNWRTESRRWKTNGGLEGGTLEPAPHDENSGKFGHRPLVSNWDRYEEKEPAVEDEESGVQDYASLLEQSMGTSFRKSHLKLAADATKATPTTREFQRLDLERVGNYWHSTALHNRIPIPEDCMSVSHRRRLDVAAAAVSQAHPVLNHLVEFLSVPVDAGEISRHEAFLGSLVAEMKKSVAEKKAISVGSSIDSEHRVSPTHSDGGFDFKLQLEEKTLPTSTAEVAKSKLLLSSEMPSKAAIPVETEEDVNSATSPLVTQSNNYGFNILFLKRFALILKLMFPEEYLAYNVGLIPSRFYEVLGNKDRASFPAVTALSFALVIIQTFARSTKTYALGTLYVTWRQLVVRSIHTIYFKGINFYKLNVLCTSIDNPTGWYGPTGLFILFLFFTILNKILMSPISRLVFEQERREGDFRFKHMQVRVNSEALAFHGSSFLESLKSNNMLNVLLKIQQRKITKQYFLDLVVSFWDYGSAIFSYVLLAIPIFAGRYDDLSSAELSAMISQTAFFCIYLTYSFSRVVDISKKVANLAGVTHRVSELLEALTALKDETSLLRGPQAAVDFRCFSSTYRGTERAACWTEFFGKNEFFAPSPRTVAIEAGFYFEKASKCALSNSLHASEAVPHKRIFMSAGKSSSCCVIYPLQEPEILPADEADKIMSYLRLVQLEPLVSRVGGIHKIISWNWYDFLSPGEMQRLCFVRLFYHRPTLALLDELSSAISEDLERVLYGELQRLGITVLTVGHRKSLRDFHQVCVEFVGDGSWTLSPLIQQNEGGQTI